MDAEEFLRGALRREMSTGQHGTRWTTAATFSRPRQRRGPADVGPTTQPPAQNQPHEPISASRSESGPVPVAGETTCFAGQTRSSVDSSALRQLPPRKEALRRGPLSRYSIWHPVRDSNPCCHLERAIGNVRLVLSDVVLCGLSRTYVNRRAGACHPVSAGVIKWSGKWSGKTRKTGPAIDNPFGV
jgi:hypothetical protein